jgi:hypothetical protein
VHTHALHNREDLSLTRFRISNETVANSSSNSNGISVESSIRKSSSQTLDRNHAKLLVLNNEPSLSSSSIMEFRGETREKFADAVEKSICTRNDVRKRSIIKLSEAGLMLTNDDNAITQCPLSGDQLCLNLRAGSDGECKKRPKFKNFFMKFEKVRYFQVRHPRLRFELKIEI